MFCTNCGWQNEEGSVFCEKCGQTLVSENIMVQRPFPQSVYTPPSGYDSYAPPFVPAAPPVQQAIAPKKKKWFVTALVLGGVLILTAVFLIAGLSGRSTMKGIWYNEKTGVVLEFQKQGFFSNRGFVISHTPEGQDEGNYTFNASGDKGAIEADGKEFAFQLEGRRIEIENEGIFEKADTSFDIEDFLDRYQN